MQQKTYTVSADFKTEVTKILQTKKFSSVFPFMNLINRDGFDYSEDELNQVVQFLGEFAYNEVADFFRNLSSMVAEKQNFENVATNSEALQSVDAE